MFLKNRFGAGYKLSITKSSPDASDPKIVELIQRSVSEAKVLFSVASEVVIQLPMNSASQFGDLFQLLKQFAKEVGVNSYGVSITSLEQVFIQLAKESAQQEIVLSSPFYAEHSTTNYPDVIQHDDDEDFPDRSIFYYLSLYFQIICTLCSSIQKRIHNSHPNASVSHMPLTIVDDEVPCRDVEMGDLNVQSSPIGMPSDTTIGNAKADRAAAISMNDLDQNSDNLERISPPKESSSYSLQSIQFYELLMKRFAIASRDARGLFFQVLLPAIQIVLVLAILTIDLNPAGKALKLNADMFQIKPTTLYSENDNTLSAPYGVGDLSTTRMNLVLRENLNTSTEMSGYVCTYVHMYL